MTWQRLLVESEDQTVVAFICQDGKTVEVKLVSEQVPVLKAWILMGTA